MPNPGPPPNYKINVFKACPQEDHFHPTSIKCEKYKYEPCEIVFETLSHNKDTTTHSTMLSKGPPPLEWNALRANENPVRIVRINGEKIVDGYAVATSFEQLYGGTILESIRFNDVNYVTRLEGRPDNKYWYPGTEKPAELVDGTILLYLDDNTKIYAVFDEDMIPFMDKKGIFYYVCKIVSQVDNHGNVIVCDNRPAILYQTNPSNQLTVKYAGGASVVKWNYVFREIPMEHGVYPA